MTRWSAVPPARRRQVWALALLAVGLAYPFVLSGGGYIDAAANAYTYVLLALGLNIVVGFAGLLDLGYAAFFAIGAYTYGAEREFVFQVDFPAAMEQHSFVQTLWARQHIASLLDAIRRNGQKQELIDEVRRIATR